MIAALVSSISLYLVTERNDCGMYETNTHSVRSKSNSKDKQPSLTLKKNNDKVQSKLESFQKT